MIAKAIFYSSIFILGYNAHAVDYYFAAGGNDVANRGVTPNAPFKTISKLNTLILNPGDNVYFKRGEEFEGQIEITNSGTSSSYITIGSYGTGALPVIKGTVRCSNWKLNSKNIYVSTLPPSFGKPSQVFYNKKLLQLARYPNQGFITIDSGNKSTVYSSLSKPKDYWKGATIHVKTARWIYEKRVIGASNGNLLTLSDPTKYMIQKGWGFFLSNLFTELDSPGEWYFDNTISSLYLISPTGSAPTNTEVEASVFDYGLRIQQQKFITVKDLNFTGQRLDGIYLDWCYYINITNNNFNQISNNGLGSGYQGCTNCTVVGNGFKNINNSGIDLAYSNLCKIKNNNLKNIALLPGIGSDGDGEYIGIFAGPNNNVESNVLDSIGYSGINGSNGDTIAHNIISHACLTKDDGGAIYFYKSKNIWVLSNIILNTVGTSEATPKPIYTLAPGIYLDDSSSFNTIESNTVIDSDYGIFVHNSFQNKVINNVLYNNRKEQLVLQNDFRVHINTYVKDNIVQGNTLYSMHPDQICMKLFTLRTNINSFGDYDYNYYCNPFSSGLIKTIDVPNYPKDSVRKIQMYDLPLWQNTYKKDAHSFISSLYKTEYYHLTPVSSNLISNSTFTSGITGWYSWGGANFSVSQDTLTDKKKMLKAYYQGKLINSVGNFASGDFRVQAGKFYNVSFELKSSKLSDIQLDLTKNSYPFSSLVNSPIHFTSNKETSTKSYTFSADSSADGARIAFTNNNIDSTMWLDNVGVFEVKADTNLSMPFTNSILLVNFLNVSRSFGLNSLYKDLNGNVVSGSIILKPYSSIVLEKISSINEIENNVRLDISTSKIYPVPVQQNEKLWLNDNNLKSGSTIKLDILTIDGTEIIRNVDLEVYDDQLEIPIQNLPKGYYFVRIKQIDRNLVYSFIVQ